MKQLLLSTLVFMSFVFVAQAQQRGLDKKGVIRKECDKIMHQIAENNIDEAFTKIGEYWVYDAPELADLENTLVTQVSTMEELYGRMLGYEFCKEIYVDNVTYHLVYAIRHELYSNIFKFTFYRGRGDKWYMVGFEWEPDIDLLFYDPLPSD